MRGGWRRRGGRGRWHCCRSTRQCGAAWHVAALADGDFALALLQLQEIKFRLLEQFQDFEYVVFGQLHRGLPAVANTKTRSRAIISCPPPRPAGKLMRTR